MPTITLFLIRPKLTNASKVVEKLDRKKINDVWIRARISRFDEKEIEINYYYEETIEDNLRKVFNGDELHSITAFLLNNGVYTVLRKVYCFMNVDLSILQVYRGPDSVTQNIKQILEKLLGVRLTRVSIDSKQLTRIMKNYSEEVNQAIFKNVDGFWYTLLRGSKLESNSKFNEYLNKNHNSLRVLSIKPTIRYLNGKRYTVTINGDKGTLKFCDGNPFKWRPRFEVRQIVYIVASTIGLV